MTHRIWQRVIALGSVLAFCAWITASSLFACPFMQATAKHPCCGKRATPRCPLSKSIQDCPFYATESKIGLARIAQHLDTPPLVAAPVIIPILTRTSAHLSSADRFRDGSGLHLRNHVLLI